MKPIKLVQPLKVVFFNINIELKDGFKTADVLDDIKDIVAKVKKTTCPQI